MTTIPRARRFYEGLLLFAAIEDYVPLWLLPGELSAAWPGEDRRNALTAREATRDLFERGLVEFYFSHHWDDDSLSRISDDRVSALLEQETPWLLPGDSGSEEWIRMSATASGESYYAALPPDDLWEVIVRRQQGLDRLGPF